MPRTKLFEDNETTITVAELREGDFLVRFEAQRGLRGMIVNSGVKAMRSEPNWWAERGPGRGQRFPVDATRIFTLAHGDVTVILPDAHRVVVRRKLVQS